MIEQGGSVDTARKHPAFIRFYDKEEKEKIRRAKIAQRTEAIKDERVEEFGAIAFAVDLTPNELAHEIDVNQDFPWIYSYAMTNTCGWEEASVAFDVEQQEVDDEMGKVLDAMRLVSQQIFPGKAAKRIYNLHTRVLTRRKGKTKASMHTTAGRLRAMTQLANKQAWDTRRKASDVEREEMINIRPAHPSDIEENPFDRDIGK